MANQIITYYLRDESPKSPVYLYALNNSNSEYLKTNGELDQNDELREKLMSLNQSLFMSETLENIDVVIPFDNVSIGKH